MGYGVCFSAISGRADPANLTALPRSMPWRLHYVPSCDISLVEWIGRPNRNNPPPHNTPKFPTAPEFYRQHAGIDLPRDFPAELEFLNLLYEDLGRAKRANTFWHPGVSGALLLSSLTNSEVMAVTADDEDRDFVCRARAGRLVSVRFRTEAREFLVGPSGETKITELDPENRGSIHRIAAEEATALCGDLAPLFGMDADPGALRVIEIGRVDFVPEAPVAVPRPVQYAPPKPAPKPPTRPWWRF